MEEIETLTEDLIEKTDLLAAFLIVPDKTGESGAWWCGRFEDAKKAALQLSNRENREFNVCKMVRSSANNAFDHSDNVSEPDYFWATYDERYEAMLGSGLYIVACAKDPRDKNSEDHDLGNSLAPEFFIKNEEGKVPVSEEEALTHAANNKLFYGEITSDHTKTEFTEKELKNAELDARQTDACLLEKINKELPHWSKAQRLLIFAELETAKSSHVCHLTID